MAQQESGEPNERKNTVLVVSPLTQLMQAQVQSLTSARINAIFISSTRVVSLEQYSLVFAEPETILATEWRSIIRDEEFQERLVCIAVDEVHCVTE